MRYAIGPLLLQSSFALPSSFDAFRCEALTISCDSEDDVFRCADDAEATAAQTNAVDLTLEEASGRPETSQAVRLEKHSFFHIWEMADGWIFSSIDQKGFLTVNRDYSHGWFFCEETGEPNEGNRNEILQLLLQAMIECRFIYLGKAVLHAACIVKDGKALAFSGPSGVGKSTRAACWVEALDAKWLSGDKPVLDPMEKRAYGVPWDGKEQLFLNVSAPVQAIVEVKRSAETFMRELTDRQKREFLVRQLMIPMWDRALAQRAFLVLKKLMDRVAVYRLYCDQSAESARESYEILFHHPENIQEVKEDRKTWKLREGFEVVEFARTDEESMNSTHSGNSGQDFEIAEITSEWLLIPVGDKAEYSGTVRLNELSAFILKSLMNPMTEEELIERILNEYEADRETVAADLKNLLASFEKMGVLAE